MAYGGKAWGSRVMQCKKSPTLLTPYHKWMDCQIKKKMTPARAHSPLGRGTDRKGFLSRDNLPQGWGFQSIGKTTILLRLVEQHEGVKKKTPIGQGHWPMGTTERRKREAEQERLCILCFHLSFYSSIGAEAIRQKYGFSSHFLDGND